MHVFIIWKTKRPVLCHSEHQWWLSQFCGLQFVKFCPCRSVLSPAQSTSRVTRACSRHPGRMAAIVLGEASARRLWKTGGRIRYIKYIIKQSHHDFSDHENNWDLMTEVTPCPFFCGWILGLKNSNFKPGRGWIVPAGSRNLAPKFWKRESVLESMPKLLFLTRNGTHWPLCVYMLQRPHCILRIAHWL